MCTNFTSGSASGLPQVTAPGGSGESATGSLPGPASPLLSGSPPGFSHARRAARSEGATSPSPGATGPATGAAGPATTAPTAPHWRGPAPADWPVLEARLAPGSPNAVGSRAAALKSALGSPASEDSLLQSPGSPAVASPVAAPYRGWTQLDSHLYASSSTR